MSELFTAHTADRSRPPPSAISSAVNQGQMQAWWARRHRAARKWGLPDSFLRGRGAGRDSIGDMIGDCTDDSSLFLMAGLDPRVVTDNDCSGAVMDT